VSVWNRPGAQFRQASPELTLFSAMPLGYRDESAPINGLRTDRAELGEIASLRGF